MPEIFVRPATDHQAVIHTIVHLAMSLKRGDMIANALTAAVMTVAGNMTDTADDALLLVEEFARVLLSRKQDVVVVWNAAQQLNTKDAGNA